MLDSVPPRSSPVRVRFAPSPTGYLHIGGVRTAYYNWLFARQHQGVFILRVDDTDAQRNVAEALEPILEGLRWLGIDWDEGPVVGGPHGPYFQSERQERYRRAVEKLLETGSAYRDYATPEELAAEREAAQAAGEPYRPSRRWAHFGLEPHADWEAEGRKAAVRLALPREGACEFDDLIRGQVSVLWAQEPDHVIQRSDGTFLYHLASVVDDLEMGITHVIRAEEHLSNTPRQIFLWRALGGAVPQLAHLPVVAEAGSRTKLSKRKLQQYLKHPDFAELYGRGRKVLERLGRKVIPETFNPVVVDFYRTVGFEPEALLNYLLLLGWSLDGVTERLSRAEQIAHFDLARVHRSPASFDPKKLWAFEQQAFRELALETRVERVLPFLREVGWLPPAVTAADREWLTRVVSVLGDRLAIGGDILEFPEFFLDGDALPIDEDAFQRKFVDDRRAQELLVELLPELQAGSFEAQALEKRIRAFLAARGEKLSRVVHAFRIAASGRTAGIGLFELLELLGRERVLQRLRLAFERSGFPGNHEQTNSQYA